MRWRSGASLRRGPASNARGVHVHFDEGGPCGRRLRRAADRGYRPAPPRSVIVRMAADTGQRLETVRIDNDPIALAAEIAKAGEHPEVVLEATYGWYWAVDVLQDQGAQVHLAHPLGIKGFAYRRVKNDERDAA